jgi:hypothetical protein
MPDDRIATVRPVEEREATGTVAAIFADIKQTKNIDFVRAPRVGLDKSQNTDASRGGRP